jgi:hypothetical protein
MKIGNIRLRVSPVNVAVVLFFSIFLIFAYTVSRSSTILITGIPLILALFLIPIGLNYLSQKQYADLVPQYQKDAQQVRIKAINMNMLGKPVRFDGVVEKALFVYLNRPQFVVGDKSGEISVKMFTSPQEDIHKGDLVEVIGMVMKRYIMTGEPVINCVSIRKIKPPTQGKNG